MKRTANDDQGLARALRRVAQRFPEAEEGIACKGTALECSTFKARKKSFLFVGRGDARLKLGASQPQASAFAAKEPGRYQVGAHGWVTVRFGGGQPPPPLEILEAWIDESYRIVAGIAPPRRDRRRGRT